MNRTPFEEALAERLGRLATHAPATPTALPTRLEQPEAARRRRVRLLLSAAAVALTLLGGAWLLHRPQTTDRVATVTTPSSPDAAPAVQDTLSTTRGVLPNGDQYEIRSEPPLNDRVEGISAGIIIDLADGAPPLRRVVGIASFQAATGAERVGPSDDGTSLVVVSGGWALHITIYQHVLDQLGPDASTTIFNAIRPRELEATSELPAFDLAAPLRWASDDEIPLQMFVEYREFVVQRGCSEIAVACSAGREIQVVPTDAVFSPAPSWRGNDVTVDYAPPQN